MHEASFKLIFAAGMLAATYVAGTIVEKRHYRSIEKRERELRGLPAVAFKTPPCPVEDIAQSRLVYGSAVISIDYFKQLLASLRNLFGGRVRSYETLVDRARREAVLRMKAMAGDAQLIVNVRLETSSIGSQANRKGVHCLEVLAYGTALTLKRK
jgi:uncharacterized protein YbjQ (UPF0145 family)